MLDSATAPLVLHPSDNVAILTARAPQGSRPLGLGVALAAPVMPGHKIAREDIAAGRRHHQVRPDHRLRDQAHRGRRARPHPELRVRRARPGLPRRRRPRGRPRRDPDDGAAHLHGLPPRQRPGRHPQLHRGLRHGELLGHRDPPRRRAGDVLRHPRATTPTSTASSPSPTAPAAAWPPTARASTTCSACSGATPPTRTSAPRSSSASAAR